VSVHADDEALCVRFALESELDDIAPRADLAAVVIGRYRRERRRRVAGAAGLAVAVAGIGVPLTVAATAPGPPAAPSPRTVSCLMLTLAPAAVRGLMITGTTRSAPPLWRPAGPGLGCAA
jgi:hypothetical protein